MSGVESSSELRVEKPFHLTFSLRAGSVLTPFDGIILYQCASIMMIERF